MLKEEHLKWYSPNLDLDIEILVFGDRGIPLIVFPTTLGSYFEAKDFFLIESIRHHIESGKVQVYCPDGVNKYSWYNKDIAPAVRVQNHIWYDMFVRDELVEKIRHQTLSGRVAVAGCSFGGYTATNFAFKYPDVVGWLISMSGSFDIKSFLDGYYDENVYFNNPVDYIRDLQHEDLFRMGIILGTSDWDICKQANFEMSDILYGKGVRHWLDVVSESAHDWPLWRHMFPRYIDAIS